MHRKFLWVAALSAAAALAQAEPVPADNTLSNALKEINDL